MSTTAVPSATLTHAAFATLMLIALMMGANHVAARVAFNHGVDVATAVSFRSTITALVVGLVLVLQRVPMRLTARHQRALPIIGLLVGVQSLCRYAAVARLPVALALLAFNTDPLWTALWPRVAYRHRPEACVLRAMPVMLLGLALALDVLGATPGWWGPAALTFLYGTAFAIMFTVLPRMGVVGNSAIMNIEPVFALVLAWAVLGQTIAPVPVGGGLPVVATVVWRGLRRRRRPRALRSARCVSGTRAHGGVGWPARRPARAQASAIR